MNPQGDSAYTQAGSFPVQEIIFPDGCGEQLLLKRGQLSWQRFASADMRYLTPFCILLNAVLLRSQDTFYVYVFIAEECPVSIYMAKPLQRLKEQFPDGVKYITVFPTSNSRDITAQKFLKDYGMQGWDVLIDRDQTIARRLGATITPEAVITNTSGEILYRGRINDAYYAPGKMRHRAQKDDLPGVLMKLKNGEEVEKPWPGAVGCYITFRK